ncbi:hypothetical protein JTB14_003078 [Gonioctena quinquepunctata]|nr:hypothetical protein JTB14_003078 [Gonioctena quinquepunctata]
MEKLAQINIDGTATTMSNRVKGCSFRKDKEMNRKDCDQFVRSETYGTEPECGFRGGIRRGDNEWISFVQKL